MAKDRDMNDVKPKNVVNLESDAEQFVRRALSHFPGMKVEEQLIKTAALKVSRIILSSQG